MNSLQSFDHAVLIALSLVLFVCAIGEAMESRNIKRNSAMTVFLRGYYAVCLAVYFFTLSALL